jgi:hypothetical protein
MVHLTNDAIQKNDGDYGKFEQANKLSFQDFEKYLAQNYTGKGSFSNDIFPKIKVRFFHSKFVRLSSLILSNLSMGN